MNLLQSATRFWRGLDRPGAVRTAMWLLPVLFGVLSLVYGQDDNWDLRNYHYYNPYALLNGKVGYDLAPAQWQSYFNPTLDLLYYGLLTTLPAQLTGFIMGALHGLNFVLVLALARRLLPAGAHRAALLLALAGMVAPGFLSELGNSMGDNLTSLCVLGALWLVLRTWPALCGGRGLMATLLAGVLMGAGCGLKMTNVSYAVALCLALLLALAGGWWLRFRAAFVFGVGVLAGLALSAGHWYWRMWSVFGNPLFPQFNQLFQAPLAKPIGIGDTGWQPQGLVERLLWPFIMSFDARRVIEIRLLQVIWPLLYLAFVALALYGLRAWWRKRPLLDHGSSDSCQTSFVLTFFVLAYLCWMNVFGIYRYLVPIELLAPLMWWLVLHRLLPVARARAVGSAGLVLAVGVVLAVPPGGWGHGHWRKQAIWVDVPKLAAPAEDLVMTVKGDPPMGWLVPAFPRQLAFVALGSGFPESAAYAQRLYGMIAARKGTLYVMMDGGSGTPERQAEIEAWGNMILARYDMAIQPDSCRRYGARIGSNEHSYQLCMVQRPAALR
ncbi:DUF2029 domain-containing protein [Duganella sp. FT80W]|uniref:DUF2029 domain-containing protein n=1 Tax=Duganella guangzhouensis TaxID=2666084 RepID=A0A6I2L407_9BURK|nr:glycosyltransferase 87 family protein [Duganella guangzhouensis]MRW92613.1 DUF2029 domain-containing protein [Duganella guangzhouensis]